MNIIRSSDTMRFKNSDDCVAIEYPIENEKDINGAIIELTGRYPEAGEAVNDLSKELVYVLTGEGTLTCAGKQTTLAVGDLALIQPDEAYHFEGTMTMFIASTPAWSPDQHRTI